MYSIDSFLGGSGRRGTEEGGGGSGDEEKPPKVATATRGCIVSPPRRALNFDLALDFDLAFFPALPLLPLPAIVGLVWFGLICPQLDVRYECYAERK